MKILKYLIVAGILMQVLLLSGCNENRGNDAGSENKGEATFNASFVMLFSIK